MFLLSVVFTNQSDRLVLILELPNRSRLWLYFMVESLPRILIWIRRLILSLRILERLYWNELFFRLFKDSVILIIVFFHRSYFLSARRRLSLFLPQRWNRMMDLWRSLVYFPIRALSVTKVWVLHLWIALLFILLTILNDCFHT